VKTGTAEWHGKDESCKVEDNAANFRLFDDVVNSKNNNNKNKNPIYIALCARASDAQGEE